MKLEAEAETEVFRNNVGGVSVTQSCAATIDAGDAGDAGEEI